MVLGTNSDSQISLIFHLIYNNQPHHPLGKFHIKEDKGLFL